MTEIGNVRTELPAPLPPVSLSVGEIVAERYRIDAVLGEGGMGIVYRAEHVLMHKTVALKVLLPEWSNMPEIVSRFEREAVAAGHITHPHVAGATDFGRLPNGSFFLVLEYINGHTLRSVIAQGPLDPARAVHIMGGMLEAMGAAHALGIVHRDLKPENIMLIDRDGDPNFVKVLDFGIAKVDGAGADENKPKSRALTQLGAVIGTPDYMSPEQATGETTDARADLYSAGVILYEMLAGECPYRGGAVTVIRQHLISDVPALPPLVQQRVDPRIVSIVHRLLEKLPAARFGSAAEVLTALKECSDAAAAEANAASQATQRGTFADLVATGRSVIADPSIVVRSGAAQRWLALVAAGIFLFLMTTVLLVRSWSAAPETVARASSATAVVSSSSSHSPPVASHAVTTLPALPATAPSAKSTAHSGGTAAPTAKSSAAKQDGAHRTGPGGIYVPPPSQWFN